LAAGAAAPLALDDDDEVVAVAGAVVVEPEVVSEEELADRMQFNRTRCMCEWQWPTACGTLVRTWLGALGGSLAWCARAAAAAARSSYRGHR